MPRPPIGPGDRTIPLVDAARRLGVTRSTMQARVHAQSPSIRGVAPHTDLNPGRGWLVSLDDVEAELRAKGLLAPAPAPAEPSVDAMRAQMLQGALNDEKDRLIAHLETENARMRAELEGLRADRDAEIARLRSQVAALGRAMAEVTAVPVS